MEDPVVSTFRKQVLESDFADIDIPKLASTLVRSSSTICQSNGSGGPQISGLVEQKREFLLGEQTRMIEYLLFEQKYMEAVAGGRTVEAIGVLQSELYQRAPVQERLHELAQLILLSQTAIEPAKSSPNSTTNKKDEQQRCAPAEPAKEHQ